MPLNWFYRWAADFHIATYYKMLYFLIGSKYILNYICLAYDQLSLGGFPF